jgi:8-oxo-dGTP diphosphatase
VGSIFRVIPNLDFCYDELMETPAPQVGIGLLVVKDGKFLLGKRISSHGTGEYSGPGGHLEYGESFETCALREMAEEVGKDFRVKNLRVLCVSNILKYMPKHYVDIGMVAEWDTGEPVVMEPHKLESWDWYSEHELPHPLFASVKQYIETYKAEQQ